MASTSCTVLTSCFGGSRSIFAINAAMMRPGTAATKNASRQPQALVIATSSSGATKLPMRLLPKFCMIPIALPRLASVVSSTTSD